MKLDASPATSQPSNQMEQQQLSEKDPTFQHKLVLYRKPLENKCLEIFLLFCDFVAKNDMTVLYTKLLYPQTVKTQKQNCKTLKKKEKEHSSGF